MWNYKRFERKTFFGLRTGQQPLSGSAFRIKYTKYIFNLLTLFTLIGGGICFYFIYQNYSLFLKLTYEFAPDLVIYLQREQAWLTLITISCILSFLTFTTFFVYRLGSNISGPVNILHLRLKELTRGRFYKGNIRVREADEFQELIETYNYFQETLKLQTEQELKTLKKIMTNPTSKRSAQLLSQMIHQKELQVNDPASNVDPSHDSRHAS